MRLTQLHIHWIPAALSLGFKKCMGVVLTTHSHLESRFRMSGYVFNVVSIATCYELDGPRIESQWGRVFQHLSIPALGPSQPSIEWLLDLFPGGKTAG